MQRKIYMMGLWDVRECAYEMRCRSTDRRKMTIRWVARGDG